MRGPPVAGALADARGAADADADAIGSTEAAGIAVALAGGRVTIAVEARFAESSPAAVGGVLALATGEGVGCEGTLSVSR